MATPVSRRSIDGQFHLYAELPASGSMFRADRGFPAKLSNNRTRARAAPETAAVPSRSPPRHKFQTVRLRAASQIGQHQMRRSKYRAAHSGSGRLIRGILSIANPSLRRMGQLVAERARGDWDRSRAALATLCARMLSPGERAQHLAYIRCRSARVSCGSHFAVVTDL